MLQLVSTVKLLAFFVLLQSTALAQNSPFIVKTSGELAKLKRLSVSRSLTTNIKTVDGYLRLKLTRKDPFKTTRISSDSRNKPPAYFRKGLFFQGTVKDRQGRTQRYLSANIIGSWLRVYMHGLRRGRGLTLSVNLDQSTASARLQILPSKFTLKCGMQQKALIKAAFPPQLLLPNRNLEFSAVIDSSYVNRIGRASIANVEGVLNTVSGIYLQQMGINLKVKQIFVSTKPITAFQSNNSYNILQSFRAQ